MTTQYQKTSRSPYHKYGKRPHVYSPAYEHWRSAVQTFGLGSEQAIEADVAFRRLNGIPLPRKEIKRKYGYVALIGDAYAAT